MLSIIRPTLILDEERVRENIERMARKAKHNAIGFRPHFKTHQSAEIGGWFRDYGVKKITVSSLQMACYFAESGWDDITIAFPVNVCELDQMQNLASTVHLNLLVSSSETADILARDIKTDIGIFIEIDTGYKRSGIDINDMASLEKILVRLGKNKHLHFEGFLTHTGQTYLATGSDQIRSISTETFAQLAKLKEYFHSAYPHAIVSVGDTPGCSVMDNFTGIDEIRPGNFIFYDLMQLQLGACRPEEVAVAMACPVVAVYPERNEIIIYGGAIHFSKEYITLPGKGSIFGMLVYFRNGKFSEPDPDIWISKLSQEHGTVKTVPHQAAHFSVGDILFFIPVHSCLTAHLMRYYQTLSGEIIQTMNS
jgi:D-serine deaminase-like pyridoxal phosphate-dependent protein